MAVAPQQVGEHRPRSGFHGCLHSGIVAKLAGKRRLITQNKHLWAELKMRDRSRLDSGLVKCWRSIRTQPHWRTRRSRKAQQPAEL
jgi:hypothetical protein